MFYQNILKKLLLNFLSAQLTSILILSLFTNYDLVLATKSSGEEIIFDTNRTRVYGPGLSPNEIVLPTRYFFIDAYDTEGNRINKSLGDRIKVQYEGQTAEGLDCQSWVQVLDRYDGTYIVRYRVYSTCYKVKLYVMYNYRHIANSPYKFDGPIYPDECHCPVEDVPTWASLNKCPKTFPQLERDMARFHDVDMNEVLNQTVEKYHQPNAKSFCNYVVLNNEIYRRCYGNHVGFSIFSDSILHSLARKMKLPDAEYIFNLGDWPLTELKSAQILPIFSWCGSNDSGDIVMPTYELTESSLEMMRRVTVDALSVQSNNNIPWSKKRPAAFWRGRDSRRERLDLVNIARRNPDLFNVSITNFFFFRDEMEEFGPKAPHESFFKFFNYKYQLNIDGTVAAYRFPYLLAGSGVVIKQDSDYFEHFYKELEPYVHYIPMKRDLSDVVEKIQWAVEHDEEAKKISENARKFVQENILPVDILCYHALLFQRWSEKMVSEVKVREEMEHVERKDLTKRFGECHCEAERKARDEL